MNQNDMRRFYVSRAIPDLPSPHEIVASLADNVYVSIDLDVLGPAIMPAVGTPEPGGMQRHEILSLLKLVASRKHVLGFDLVELYPSQGHTSCAFLAAKLARKLIGYVTL